MNDEQVYNLIRKEKIIAILRGVSKDHIINVAQAILDAGVKLLEITCNTQGVFELLELLNEKMSGKILIGAGTVITQDLCKSALNAGAKYIIAPDVNPDVIDYCIRKDVAILPGAATPTEILTARRHGAKMVKIFPAAALGIDYIKQLRGPIDDVDFVAVGGITPATASDFLAAGCSAIAVGQSAIKKDLIEKNDWQAITQNVKKYIETLR